MKKIFLVPVIFCLITFLGFEKTEAQTSNPQPTRFTSGLLVPNTISSPFVGAGSLWYQTGKLAFNNGSIWQNLLTETLASTMYVPGTRNITINGVTLDLSADRTWSVTGAVTSVFGRTGAITAQISDYDSFYPSLSVQYSNPTWVKDLSWIKITGTPTTVSGYGITDAVPTSRTINGLDLTVNRTLTTTNISEGTNLYFLGSRTLAVGLSGFSVGANSAITAGDNILGALAKTQGQIQARVSQTRLLNNGFGILGGGDLSSDRTLSVDSTAFRTTANSYTLSQLQSKLNAYELLNNKSITTTLGTSNTLYPTQNAVKVYVDNSISTASSNYAPSTRDITINGITQNLTANRIWNVGTVTSLTPGIGFNSLTPITTSGTLNLDTVTATSGIARKGFVTDRLAAKQNTLTLTTTGTSGAATLTGSTLNIPNYAGGSVGTLQTVTDAGNVTTNAMQFTGIGNYNTSLNSLSFGYSAGVGSLSTKSALGTTSLILTGQNASFSTDSEISLTLAKPSISGVAGTFGGRVKITDGTQSDDAVSLGQLNTKQATLVSGTNIKTINGSSILGSGDLVISGGTNYWNRTSNVLSTANANDLVTLSSNASGGTSVLYATGSSGTNGITGQTDTQIGVIGRATGTTGIGGSFESALNTGSGGATIQVLSNGTGDIAMFSSKISGVVTNQVYVRNNGLVEYIVDKSSLYGSRSVPDVAYVQSLTNKYPYLSKTANYTVLTTDWANTNTLTITVDASAGAVTITLPAASTTAGKIINIKKMDSSANTVTVNGGGTNIDGASTSVISMQYGNAMIQSISTQYITL